MTAPVSGWTWRSGPGGRPFPATVAAVENGTITFVNTQSKSFTVKKLWVGETPAEGTTVQVALYRTTDEKLVGSVQGEAVPQDELKPDGEKRKATLNSENKWSAAFAKLPVEDKDGNAYTYYALELGSDGNPIAEDGRFALNGKDYRVDYEHETDKTTIRNTPSASISGTKTWKDNGNAYGTRPDTLQLTLERTTNPNAEQPQWETVQVGTDGVTFCWTESGEKSDGAAHLTICCFMHRMEAPTPIACAKKRFCIMSPTMPAGTARSSKTMRLR